jgi:hypothetical protein
MIKIKILPKLLATTMNVLEIDYHKCGTLVIFWKHSDK